MEIPAISEIPGIREHEAFIVRGIDQENMDKMYTGDTVLEGKADYRHLADGDGILVCPSGAVSDERVAISGLEDTITVLESGMKGGAEKGLYRLRRQTNFARSSDIEPKEGNEYDMAF